MEFKFRSTSNVVLPDSSRNFGKSCIGLSPGEIASVSYAEFAQFVRSEAGAAGLSNADWTMSGVHFWFTGNAWDENGFRLEDAFRWMKAVDYLMSWQKDQSRIACVTLAASNLGVTQWRILNRWGILFVPERAEGRKRGFQGGRAEASGHDEAGTCSQARGRPGRAGFRLGHGMAEKAGEELAV